MPDSEGIAALERGTSAHKKTIHRPNSTQAPITLSVIQPPAPWAKVKVPSKRLAPGDAGALEVTVDGSVDVDRFTSITLAPADDSTHNRVTLAIRTGTPPV